MQVSKLLTEKIYIGSVNGFNAFYPHQIKTNHVRPPVVITALEIFNKQIPVGNKLLPKSLNRLEELELSYKENAFSFALCLFKLLHPQ